MKSRRLGNNVSEEKAPADAGLDEELIGVVATMSPSERREMAEVFARWAAQLIRSESIMEREQSKLARN